MAAYPAGQVVAEDTENQQHEFRPLRARADVLIVLLAGTVVAVAARLVVPMLDRNAPAFSVEMDVKPFVVASRILIVVTGVAFVAWFRGARINAEGRGWHQRFARAWTFWGWIVPVVNLWIPLQIMDDIWQVSFLRRPRGWIAWLPMVWWTSWVLSEALLVLNRGAVVALDIWTSPPANSAGSYGPHLPDSWPGFCVFAVAGLSLIAIVRTVSRGPLGAPIAPIAPIQPEFSAAG
jgi:hypothetical protein